jgi:HNH endonuclease
VNDDLKVLKPTEKTLRLLYAKSGNRCAFPGCPTPISDGQTLFGEAAHIKAESPKGPRYDPSQTPEQRRSFDNLILLCGVHHKCVDDDVVSYTVDRLIQMKRDHEAKATRIEEDEVNRVAGLLADTSIIVTVVNPYQNITTGVFHQTITNNYGSATRHQDLAQPYQGVLAKDGFGRFRSRGVPLGTSTPHPFAVDSSEEIYLEKGPCFWFRLLPTAPPIREWNFRDLQIAAGANSFRLVGIRGIPAAQLRSHDGIGRYEAIGLGEAYTTTLLFRKGEIWSIDTRMSPSEPMRFFAIGLVRSGIPQLLKMATETLVALGVPAPFRWIVGVEGIRGFQLAYETNQGPPIFAPRIQADHAIASGLHAPGDEPKNIVDAFTDAVFAESGMPVPIGIL